MKQMNWQAGPAPNMKTTTIPSDRQQVRVPRPFRAAKRGSPKPEAQSWRGRSGGANPDDNDAYRRETTHNNFLFFEKRRAACGARPFGAGGAVQGLKSKAQGQEWQAEVGQFAKMSRIVPACPALSRV